VILTINHKEGKIEADLSSPLDISIAVQRENSVGSFGIKGATYNDYKDGDFIGNKNLGGPCNLETITFTPHGNSTHTECLGHIALTPYFVNECIEDEFNYAKLVSLKPAGQEKEAFLDFTGLDFEELINYTSLIIRTLPNAKERKNHDYSGENAPFIRPKDMQKIIDSGIKHLVMDLPSVDPEWDGGALASHHVFWNYPDKPRTDASISEFAYIPNEIEDGNYILKLNISPFISDAAPSRPVLYPIIAG
jgi:hypothetical protein